MAWYDGIKDLAEGAINGIGQVTAVASTYFGAKAALEQQRAELQAQVNASQAAAKPAAGTSGGLRLGDYSTLIAAGLALLVGVVVWRRG